MTNHYPPEEVIIKLKKLIRIIEQFQADIGNEITHAQKRIIFPIVRDSKGYTIQELSQMCCVTKGLVSRTVADLESKGFVERDKKTENQDRNYKIILSAKGQQFVAEKRAKMQHVSSQWEGKLTHEDFGNFIKVLDVLTNTRL